MDPETRRRRKRMSSSDDAVLTENPKTAIMKKRGRTRHGTPNKTLEKDTDWEDDVMGNMEVEVPSPPSVSRFTTKRKRSSTERKMPDVEMSSSEDQAYMLGSAEAREPSNKVSKLSVSEEVSCSDDNDVMEVQENEEDRDEGVDEGRSFFRAGDGKERDPCVKHLLAERLESRIPIKMSTYEPKGNLYSRHNCTETRQDSIQRPVASSPGAGIQSQEGYGAVAVVNQRLKCHRDVTLDEMKANQRNANSLAHLAVSYSSGNQGNRIAFKDPNIVERTEERSKTLLSTLILVLLCFLVVFLLLVDYNTDLVDPHDMNMTISFEAQFMELESQFPGQRAELWKRSKIHLVKNLKTNQRKEPFSMILTSGLRAKKTLHCLAVCIATALSSALNVTGVQIDGAGKALLDSNQVKLDIDKKFMEAFTDDKAVAVIHQFEELPPGSTLIFYKYCDHENAAFKNAFLIFTVLLPVEELNPELSLNEVEEMVQDDIKGRFLSSGQPAVFDAMDVDKFGGLWSRISHLILPVSPEADTEQNGCHI